MVDSLFSLIMCLLYTVESLNRGHFGTTHFVPCREAVLFWEVKCIAYTNVPCREVVLSRKVGSTVVCLCMCQECQ